MRIRLRHAVLAAFVLVSSALAGCEDGRKRPPQVNARIVHAAPERGTIAFRREQRDAQQAQLEFRQASGELRYDVDQYDFNAFVPDPDGNAVLLGAFQAELEPEADYLFVVTEASGVFTPIVVDSAVEAAGGDSRIIAVHAAPSLGSMSLYVEPPGTSPSAASPIATLSFGDSIDDAVRAPGEHRLLLTEAGNPANVLLTSDEFELAAGRKHTFAIIDPAGDSTAPIGVVAIGASSTVLIDEAVRPRLQVINGAADEAPRDIYIDEDFTAPLVAAAPYLEEVTVDFQSGEQTLSVTPAGNTGVVDDEATPTIGRSGHYTLLISGEPGDVDAIVSLDDRRAYANQARLRVLNVASRNEPLEVFIVRPGTDITGGAPSATLVAPGISGRFSLPLEDLELVFRDGDTETVLAGPVPISLDEGIYTVLVANGPDPDTLELIYLEDFE